MLFLLAILDTKCKSRDHHDLSFLSIHLLPKELHLKAFGINLAYNEYKGLKQIARTHQTRYRDQMGALQEHLKNSNLTSFRTVPQDEFYIRSITQQLIFYINL